MPNLRKSAVAVAILLQHAVAFSAPPNAAGWALQILDSKLYPDAKCLDGSQAGYWFWKSPNPDFTTKWIIYQEGGGWCMNKEDCAYRAEGYLGSAAKLSANYVPADPYMSSDCKINPDWCEYNKVFTHYCDGNSFVGDLDHGIEVDVPPSSEARDQSIERLNLQYGSAMSADNSPVLASAPETGTSAKKMTIYFRGRDIIDSVIDATYHKAMNAEKLTGTDVLLTGCSAGGLATFLNADRIREKHFPNVGKYKAMPVSGFFLHRNTVYNEQYYPGYMKVVSQLSNATLPEACVKGLLEKGLDRVKDKWYCNFAEAAYEVMDTDVLMLNSALDQWQLGNIFTQWYAPLYKNWTACLTTFENCTNSQLEDLEVYKKAFMTTVTESGRKRALRRQSMQAEQEREKRSHGFSDFLSTPNRHEVQTKKQLSAYYDTHSSFINTCLTHCEAVNLVAWKGFKINGVAIHEQVSKWWNNYQVSHLEPCDLNIGVDADGEVTAELDLFEAKKTTHQCNPTCFLVPPNPPYSAVAPGGGESLVAEEVDAPEQEVYYT